MHFIPISIYIFILHEARGAPIDSPIRVDLPVYVKPERPSGVTISHSLEPENHPGNQPRNEKGFVDNLLSKKLQAVSSVPGHGYQSLEGGFGIFANPIRTREDALPETEGWGSKTLSVKENIHNKAAGIFQPKPLVDTIREEEKYGNSGDKFQGVGNAVVGSAAGVSNLVNSVLEVPGNILKNIVRVATEKLNNFGGKLIGLN